MSPETVEVQKRKHFCAMFVCYGEISSSTVHPRSHTWYRRYRRKALGEDGCTGFISWRFDLRWESYGFLSYFWILNYRKLLLLWFWLPGSYGFLRYFWILNYRKLLYFDFDCGNGTGHTSASTSASIKLGSSHGLRTLFRGVWTNGVKVMKFQSFLFKLKNYFYLYFILTVAILSTSSIEILFETDYHQIESLERVFVPEPFLHHLWVPLGEEYPSAHGLTLHRPLSKYRNTSQFHNNKTCFYANL